jgi:ribose/xylose/arabinose/galactoside ABC-type transport system permease subunit
MIAAGARKRARALPVELGAAAVLAVAVAWMAGVSPDFRTGQNLYVILSGAAEIAIVSAGMTLVIATGGIDISVGSVVGFCSVLFGVLTVNHGWSVFAGGAVAVCAGLVCGLVNGLLVARFRVPPIVATLAMFSAARSGAYVLSGGNSISPLPDAMVSLGYGSWLGIPATGWVAAVSLLAVGILLKRTSFGRSVLALGGNRDAAFMSGLRTARIEAAVYALCGALAGVAALVVSARASTAIPDAGRFFEMSAVTAVVMGGTPTSGGRATAIGTLLGVLTIGVLRNAVRTYGKDDIWVLLVLGLALLLSVEVDRWRANRAARQR